MSESVSDIVNARVNAVGLRSFARELGVSPGLVHYAVHNNPGGNSKIARALRNQGYYIKPKRITSRVSWESEEQKQTALRYVQRRGFKGFTEYLRSIGNCDLSLEDNDD